MELDLTNEDQIGGDMAASDPSSQAIRAEAVVAFGVFSTPRNIVSRFCWTALESEHEDANQSPCRDQEDHNPDQDLIVPMSEEAQSAIEHEDAAAESVRASSLQRYGSPTST